MSKKTALLVAIVCLSVLSSVALASDLGYVSGELLVKFAPKPDGRQRTKTERSSLLASIDGGLVKHTYKIVPGLTLVKLPDSLTVENALTIFKNTNGILYAVPNYRGEALSTEPNDPIFSQQWALHNIGQTGGTPGADVNAPKAWDIHTGSNEIIVAVIDTGVDYDHNDLAGNMWVNPGEIPANGIDDDENGYIDDVYGYDFCTLQIPPEDSDPMDEHGHGTACAGIVGAVGDNNEGVVGVCWNVRIMALKWFNSQGDGKTSDAIKCIDYAVEMGANVMSNSWRSENSPPLWEAIKNADANGVLVVAAAGNGNTRVYYPARYPETIAVGATDHNDQRCTYSNYGPELDVMAPSSDKAEKGEQGGLIFWTTDITGTGGYNNGDVNDGDAAGNYTKWFGGTSAATPHVAGLAALMLSLNRSLTVDEVQSIIESTADDLGDPGWDPNYGWGRINAYNAIVEVGKQTLALSKIDDVNDGSCVSAGDYIKYTIYYGNPVNDENSPIYIGPVSDVNIIDYLPEETDFVSATGPNMVYDSDSNTVSWQIGTLSPGETSSVTLTVKVNVSAERLGTITNYCEIEGDAASNAAKTNTPICYWCWGDIIYVDANADPNGYNNGISWQHAHKDLQDALDNACNCNASQIWVAAGTYKPTTNPNDYDANFALVDSVAIYGGFAGNETSLNQRNWGINETILCADLRGENNAGDFAYYAVVASDLNETTTLDWLTIRRGYSAAIKIDGSPVTLQNCKIERGYKKGIECINGASLNVKNCEIKDNGYDSLNTSGIYNSASVLNVANSTIENNKRYGVHCIDGNSVISQCHIKNSFNHGVYGTDAGSERLDILVDNCLIEDNGADGVYTYEGWSNIVTNCIIRRNYDNGLRYHYVWNWATAMEIKNNWICDNNANGIFLDGVDKTTIIRNNTIVDNAAYGIKHVEEYQSANVSNCIIWDNGDKIDDSLYGSAYNVTYSCIQDCNYTVNPDLHNICSDPCFIDASAGNYHLDPNVPSPCIDAGDPNFAPERNEKDIDGDPRVMTLEVDMGADEAAYFPTCHPDYNEWLDVGKPTCWCYPRQCHGDADGIENTYGRGALSWVSSEDIAILIQGFREIYGGDPDVDTWICADFDHQLNTYGRGATARVSSEDVEILTTYFREVDANIPADCLNCQAAAGQSAAEPVDIEPLIEQLEQIWDTHEELRELISADDWQRFIESLKEQTQN